MNPDEFPWAEDQQVTVTNPTDETYKFKVHNKDYEVRGGKTVKMPGYIAWVYVYGLATQLAQADGVFNRWNEETFRQDYYEKIVVGADQLVTAIEEEPEVELEEVDSLDDEEAADSEEEGTVNEPAPAAPAAPATKPATATVEPMQPKAKAAASGK